MAEEDTTPDSAATADDAEALLSDEEKEALLAGVEEGVVGAADTDAARVVRPYEIRPDAQINYGSYPRLQAICQHLAKRAAQLWAGLLKCPISITAEDVFTATYATAIAKSRAPIITTKLELKPLPAHSIVIVDNTLLAGLVEAFFGVTPSEDDEDEPQDTEAITVRQQFTAGELRVAELALHSFYTALPDAWEKMLALQPRELGREFDPTVGTGVEPKTEVLVCRFLVNTGVHQGYLRLLLPDSQMAGIADDLEGAVNARNPDGDPVWRQAIKEHLADTDVCARVRVGHVRLPLRQLIALKAGDLLPLEAPEHGALWVGDQRCASGGFGIVDGHNAFQLHQWLVQSPPGNRTRH